MSQRLISWNFSAPTGLKSSTFCLVLYKEIKSTRIHLRPFRYTRALNQHNL
uniref:Uncharacterized protein n=1 Tax=Octopus bimaculoides TaxID=37653 RepID=A0A0L8GLQ7_OCTBM